MVPLLLVGAAFLPGEVLLPTGEAIVVVAVAAGGVDPRLVNSQMVCGFLTKIRTKAIEAEVNLIHSSERRQGN